MKFRVENLISNNKEKTKNSIPEEYAKKYFKSEEAKKIFENPDSDVVTKELQKLNKALEISFTEKEIDFSGMSGNEIFEGEGWNMDFSWESLGEAFDKLSEVEKERVLSALSLRSGIDNAKEKMKNYLLVKNYNLSVDGNSQKIIDKEKSNTISIWSKDKNFSGESFHASSNVVLGGVVTTLPKLLAYTHELGHAEYFSSASEEDKNKLTKSRSIFVGSGGRTDDVDALNTVLFDEHIAWDNAIKMTEPLLKKLEITQEQIDAHTFLEGRSTYESRVHWVFGEE